ncbi:hypothetical protein CR513_45478, partial [Mucuna pruriens]
MVFPMRAAIEPQSLLIEPPEKGLPDAQGANNVKAREHVRDFVFKFRHTFFIIMETHVQFVNTYTNGLWILVRPRHYFTVEILDTNLYSSTFDVVVAQKRWITLKRMDSLGLMRLEQTLRREHNHILFQEELLWY